LDVPGVAGRRRRRALLEAVTAVSDCWWIRAIEALDRQPAL